MGTNPRARLRLLPVVILMLAAGCAAPASGPAAAADADARRARIEALRRTPAVEVYEAARDSVVTVAFSRTENAPPADPSAARPSSAPSGPAAAPSPTGKPSAAKHPAAKPPAAGPVTKTENGSGVVIHEAGYVLTNAHILRHGGQGRVGFADGTSHPVRVAAVDEGRDLAILKIAGDGRFKAVPLGHSGGLRVGEPVIAIGNPFQMGLTVAVGIVAALGRATKSDFTFFPEMIQTDAGTNIGNSGGPLLNVAGEVIGLNTTKKTEADNIGFAIPSDRIREALPAMLSPEARRGFTVGLTVAPGSPACVTAVAAGSPAEAAGLRVGDVVTGLGREAVRCGLDYVFALAEAQAGQAMALAALRDGRAMKATLTPAAAGPRAK